MVRDDDDDDEGMAIIQSMRSFLIRKYLYYNSVNYLTDRKREWRLAKSGIHSEAVYSILTATYFTKRGSILKHG